MTKLYIIENKHTCYISDNKQDVIYKHVEFSRRDKMRYKEATVKNFSRPTKKVIKL